MERNHLFDAMRGAAAIVVVLYHFKLLGLGIATYGFVAVDFFFVLSGYVIAQAYEKRLSDGLGFFKFFEIRLIRLYPLVFVGLAIGLIQLFSWDEFHHVKGRYLSYATSFIINIFLIPAWTNVRDLFPSDGPVWSLFFELLANIFFAAFLFKASKKILLSVVMVGATVFVICVIFFNSADIGWEWSNFAGGIARVAYGFTIGQILFRLRGKPKMLRQSWWALAPIVVLIAILVTPIGSSFGVVWPSFCILAVSPFLVWLASGMDLPKALWIVAAYLGDLSYPLYAFHLPMIHLLASLVRKTHASTGHIAVAVFPVLIILASIAERYYDKPIRRLLSQWFSVKRSAKTQII